MRKQPVKRVGLHTRAQESDGAASTVPAEAPPADSDSSNSGKNGNTKEAQAVKSRVKMSPFKVRKVLNTIRGRDYEECLMKLEFMRYRACEPVLKTLISAASNAKHNYGMNKAKLYVSECKADEGTYLKRAEPRALGQAFRYRKKQTHITIRLRERSG